jgi:hypothetical protein
MEEIHLLILAATVSVILYADHLGFQYFRGIKETLSIRTVTFLHRATWIGLLGMIASGIYLFIPIKDELLAEPVFLLKLFFVFVLFCNGVLIGKIARKASESPFHALPSREKRILILSGAASACSWIGAASIGFLFL